MTVFKTLLLGIICVLSLTSCVRNDEQVATKADASDTASATKQYFCVLGLVYRKDVDACVVPYFEQEKQVVPVKVSKPRVIDYAVARPGDGLISLTRNTRKPLNVEKASSLAKEYGRYDPKYKGPKLRVGERIFLFETDVSGQKISEWKIDTGELHKK